MFYWGGQIEIPNGHVTKSRGEVKSYITLNKLKWPASPSKTRNYQNHWENTKIKLKILLFHKPSCVSMRLDFSQFYSDKSYHNRIAKDVFKNKDNFEQAHDA